MEKTIPIILNKIPNSTQRNTVYFSNIVKNRQKDTYNH